MHVLKGNWRGKKKKNCLGKKESIQLYSMFCIIKSLKRKALLALPYCCLQGWGSWALRGSSAVRRSRAGALLGGGGGSGPPSAPLPPLRPAPLPRSLRPRRALLASRGRAGPRRPAAALAPCGGPPRGSARCRGAGAEEASRRQGAPRNKEPRAVPGGGAAPGRARRRPRGHAAAGRGGAAGGAPEGPRSEGARGRPGDARNPRAGQGRRRGGVRPEAVPRRAAVLRCAASPEERRPRGVTPVGEEKRKKSECRGPGGGGEAKPSPPPSRTHLRSAQSCPSASAAPGGEPVVPRLRFCFFFFFFFPARVFL